MNEELEKAKNLAYWERNQLVSALSKIFPSYLAKHPVEDKEWEDDWRTIVVVIVTNKNGREQQLTWHIHDHDVPMFDHLEYKPSFEWDGHTTEEKYRRLRNMETGP